MSPKQTRWVIKRSLEFAINGIVRSQEFVVREGVRFETVHPEVYQQFCDIVGMLEETKKEIEKLYEVI